MGLLRKGEPLRWEDSLKHLAYVKKHGTKPPHFAIRIRFFLRDTGTTHETNTTLGILQFLHIYSTLKDRTRDEFLWGDEVSSCVLQMFECASGIIFLRALLLLLEG